MAEHSMKTGKVAEKVVGAYKAIEDGVVGAYKKIEDKFVDTFLEQTDECWQAHAAKSDTNR